MSIIIWHLYRILTLYLYNEWNITPLWQCLHLLFYCYVIKNIHKEREWKRNTTFEVQKQHSNSLGKSSSFSNFLSTFLLLSYKQRWREKKEQNSETVASRNTDMKGKHCMKEWRKLFLEWNRVLNRTKWDSVLVIQADFWICAMDKFDTGPLPTLKSLGNPLRQLTYANFWRTFRSISFQKATFRYTRTIYLIIYIH